MKKAIAKNPNSSFVRVVNGKKFIFTAAANSRIVEECNKAATFDPSVIPEDAAVALIESLLEEFGLSTTDFSRIENRIKFLGYSFYVTKSKRETKYDVAKEVFSGLGFTDSQIGVMANGMPGYHLRQMRDERREKSRYLEG